MKTFFLSLILTLATAASLVVLVDRFRGSGADQAEALMRIEQRLSALEQTLIPSSSGRSVSPGAGAASLPPGSPTLSEVVNLLHEIEGMLLDSERALRQDLVGMYERLLVLIQESATAGAPADPGEAKRTLRAKLMDMGVTLIDEEGQLEMSGEISESNRALELLAVAPGGRAFESLLLVQVTPSALKIGLEDLGLTESDPDRETWSWSDDASGAYVYVMWDGLKKPRRAEDLVLNSDTNETMQRTRWMFTASRFFTDTRTWERHFAADLYKNLVAITFNYSQEAILACPLQAAANELIWFPHPDFCPKPGTKVRILVRRDPKPEWDKL